MPPFMKGGICKGFVKLEDYQECIDQALQAIQRLGVHISVGALETSGSPGYEKFDVVYQVKDQISEDVHDVFLVEAWLSLNSTDFAATAGLAGANSLVFVVGSNMNSANTPPYAFHRAATNSLGKLQIEYNQISAADVEAYARATVVRRVHRGANNVQGFVHLPWA
jgi:hypothetical protein